MRQTFSLRIWIYAKLGQCDSGHVHLPPLLGPRNRGLLVYGHAHSLSGFVKRAPYRPREKTGFGGDFASLTWVYTYRQYHLGFHASSFGGWSISQQETRVHLKREHELLQRGTIEVKKCYPYRNIIPNVQLTSPRWLAVSSFSLSTVLSWVQEAKCRHLKKFTCKVTLQLSNFGLGPH